MNRCLNKSQLCRETEKDCSRPGNCKDKEVEVCWECTKNSKEVVVAKAP